MLHIRTGGVFSIENARNMCGSGPAHNGLASVPSVEQIRPFFRVELLEGNAFYNMTENDREDWLTKWAFWCRAAFQASVNVCILAPEYGLAMVPMQDELRQKARFTTELLGVASPLIMSYGIVFPGDNVMWVKKPSDPRNLSET